MRERSQGSRGYACCTDSRMKTEAAVGLLLLLVRDSFVEGEMLNLTATAEKYLNNTVRPGWETWGLDENYEYWSGRHYMKPEHPIRGTVEEFHQDENCKRPQGLEDRVCRERFTWTFNDGIWSPFQLLVNVTVTHVGLKNETFLLDLNNATLITRPQRLGLNVMRVAYTRHTTCYFHAQVKFDGWFAYKIKEKRGDVPDYYPVGIGELNGWAKGLLGDGRSSVKIQYVRHISTPISMY
ncbi:uncharacterized protein LOC119450612 isoform X4 [Dermacentor silvarum]|uniref:uncharacterized protein LOC119450612 isoform X3 n=1 Tax=Dermacentor silvarum TaxID=543639 RepID=UPI0021010073|nr:uncharacterized protein LOC119450612 isoform X3 [Dermacentor silvarum]XP_049521986.1 uncharacterized protein LOC119450612 isoform X4 [Dermacentor silvarum]